MRKKSAILIVLLCFLFCSCGTKQITEQTDKRQMEQSETDTQEETADSDKVVFAAQDSSGSM